MASVGISLVIVDAQTSDLAADSRRLLGASIGVGLVALGLLEATLRESADEPTHRAPVPLMKIGIGLAAVLLTWIDIGLTAVTLCALLLLALVVNIVYGAYVWFHAPLPGSVHPVDRERIADLTVRCSCA